MPRDVKPQRDHKAKKREILPRKKKCESDESDDGASLEEEEEEDEIDIHEFRKYLHQVMPSKHLRNKIQAGEKVKQLAKEVETNKSTKSKAIKPSKQKADKHKEESDEEESDEEESDDEDEDVSKKNNVNIIFAIGGIDEDEDEWEDYTDDEDSSNAETEDEDVSVSSEEDEPDEEEDEEDDNHAEKEALQSAVENNEVLTQLKEMATKHPGNKWFEKCVERCEAELMAEERKKTKKEKKQKAKQLRIFRKIMMDKNAMNDFSFYEKLDCEHQKHLIKELREVNKVMRVEKPYRISLLEADIPLTFKAAAFKKVNMMRMMDAGTGEFNKIKNWVDTFMKVPFTNYHSLPITIEDGVEACHSFMENAQKTLDQAVYGLNDAKMQVMQMLGQLITNPQSIGTAIAIHGPPGTGKTSLVKEGISKILNRPFAFIALGGATDSSFLEGHGYTYEGSTWGKIVQILIDSKCMNPVIYFDELDKISDTPRGEEIVGILTHLTDTTQNSEFHDKYFSEINFDLSKCLFIFSYNDENKVNPILKDRMYRIKTKGYSTKEKTVIANQYLLPKIQEQVKFSSGDIIIPDDVLQYINDVHCHKEDGVRNMKRCLEIIHTKLNLYRLMRPGSNLFEGEMSLQVEFPFKVTKDIVDKLIKKDEDSVSKYIRDTMYI